MRTNDSITCPFRSPLITHKLFNCFNSKTKIREVAKQSPSKFTTRSCFTFWKELFSLKMADRNCFFFFFLKSVNSFERLSERKTRKSSGNVLFLNYLPGQTNSWHLLIQQFVTLFLSSYSRNLQYLGKYLRINL